jgi:hypothetical protein
MQTAMIFVIQYLTILYTHLSFPALPMYAPIGIAFVMFYLLGNNAVWGLVLGSFCGYLVRGLSISPLILYSIADVGCGFIGAFLSQRILSSDIKPFENRQECVQFIVINALITCVLSSSLRIMTVKFNLYHYIDLWLGDLNATLIFSGLLLTWLCVPFSREKIFTRPINKLPLIVFSISAAVYIILMPAETWIYLIIATMVFSVYLSYVYGSLIGTALLFLVSSTYQIYFMLFKQYYYLEFGLTLYTVIPIALFVYVVLITVGFRTKRSTQPTKKFSFSLPRNP